MKKYILTASYKENSTTHPIKAHDDFGARVEAANIIRINHASDKRIAKGTVLLKNETGRVVSFIKRVEDE